MADTLDPKHLDKRTAERYLRGGQLDEKAYERHIKGLPDVADKAAPVETAMDDEGYDVDDELEDEDEGEDEDEDEGEDELEGDEEAAEEPTQENETP